MYTKESSINLNKHQVSFLTAAAIFADEIVERVGDGEVYGELDSVPPGTADRAVYRVVFIRRGQNLTPIISARKASNDEREIYHRATFP